MRPLHLTLVSVFFYVLLAGLASLVAVNEFLRQDFTAGVLFGLSGLASAVSAGSLILESRRS